MFFSILVANYNNGHFFKACYESILAQTHHSWEVVIVDDCSTDNSVNRIKEIIGDDERFKLFINHRNRGCGYTKNRCVRYAKGEITGFLDPDDTLVPEALEVMIKAHREHNDAAIITSRYELMDSEMNFIGLGNHGGIVPRNKSYLTYGKGVFTHFATFKVRMYNMTPGINTRMKRAVDQDLYYKMEEQGQHVFIDRILYRYRQHLRNISRGENLYKAEYWHFYAKLKAFKRRKSLKQDIDNFSYDEIKKMKSNYFLMRMKKSSVEKRVWSSVFFYLKAIQAYPWHRFYEKTGYILKQTLNGHK